MAAIGDGKMSLRKLEYPLCAVEALSRLEGLIASRNKQNLAMQIISEFIFLERSKDGDVRKMQTLGFG